jgi:TolB-like protein
MGTDVKDTQQNNYLSVIAYLRLFFLPALLLVSIHGCSFSSKESKVRTPTETSLGNAEYYTSALADELFEGLLPNDKARFAVATFVPVTTLQFDVNNQSPLMLLGHQLEQGLITEASKRGFIAQDYKASNDIIIEKQADRVFSRDVNDLHLHHHSVDFYISGTIVEQQAGAIVNARIINVKSKDVVAAATQFFPSDLFWSSEKVSSRQGYIYRSGTE